MLTRDTLTKLLDEFADWLEFEGAEPVEWVVCGGVALALQNLNQRTTWDVDVLGEWNASLLEVTCIKDFPTAVKSAIRRVVVHHPELTGFGDNWINVGPGRLAEHGLPKGYSSRLNTMKFGGTLTLHMLDRVDLIPLKLYAASDRLGARQAIHLQDLKVLNGSYDEMDAALEWVKTVPEFDEMRPEIQAVLTELGHEDLAFYV